MQTCSAGYISQLSQDLTQRTSTVRQDGAEGADEVRGDQGGSAPVGGNLVAALPQSVRDALADAETLIRYLESEWCSARHLGGRSARRLNYGRLRNLRARTFTGAWEPREIARAAFRAVPGLRGEGAA